MIKRLFGGFTKFEWCLWLGSLMAIAILFSLGSDKDVWTCLASMVGATALVFLAKGDVVGQILTVLFSLLYAVVAFQFRYYGEMITYLCMTGPTALAAAVSWIRHPYEAGKREVQISGLTAGRLVILTCLSGAVTFAFFYLLRYFHTANLLFSTVSITTSFLASGLMVLRSPYYALAYSANDIVLIILWVLASIEDSSYMPMVLCFVIFLVNDIYGFINWRRMRKKQENGSPRIYEKDKV